MPGATGKLPLSFPFHKFLGHTPFLLPESLSTRLIFYRKVLGLSQRAMARRIGVDPTTVVRWEEWKG